MFPLCMGEFAHILICRSLAGLSPGFRRLTPSPPDLSPENHMASGRPSTETVVPAACAPCDERAQALRCTACFVGLVHDVVARSAATAAQATVSGVAGRIRLVLDIESTSDESGGPGSVREVGAAGLNAERRIPAAGASALLQARTADASYCLALSTILDVLPDPAGVALEARFGFTRKEARVARLLAEGRPNKEIARVLFVSPHTARHHTQHLMLKLGARSRTAAAAMILGGQQTCVTASGHHGY